MRVLINDEVGQSVLGEEEIRSLVESVLRGEELEEDYEVSVSFVTRDRIHELNREYRGIDKPTDVLSFVIDDPFEDEDTDEYESNKVSGVIQKGYMMKSKVLRPSMVKVAK